MTTTQRILSTNGSVNAIRSLGLSNAELIAAAKEISAMPGYHGQIECEPDCVTGEVVPVRERSTPLQALCSAIVLAQT